MSPITDLRHRIDTEDNGLILCPLRPGRRLVWMDPDQGPPHCPACGASIEAWVMLPEPEEEMQCSECGFTGTAGVHWEGDPCQETEGCEGSYEPAPTHQEDRA